MSRSASDTDYHLDVDDVGHFVFARRMMRDEMRIAAEFSRLTEGVDTPTTYLAQMCTWMATLKVLLVEGPTGWDVDTLDPLEQDSYDKILLVYGALRAKEEDFRRQAKAGVKARR
jgi:hypothetical protein